MLEDPSRNQAIKNQLRVGMQISYFDPNENRLLDATIIQIKRTQVLLKNTHDYKLYKIPFYMLNINNVNTSVTTSATKGTLSKLNLKVGDNVGWLSAQSNQELFGTVVKLNPKRAKIKLPSGTTWNVPYNMLFPTLEGSSTPAGHDTGLLIEGDWLA